MLSLNDFPIFITCCYNMLLKAASFIFLCSSIHGEFLKGVNYGNIFVPEDWMAGEGVSIYGGHYGPVVSPPSGVARVSLCDVTDDR